MPLATPMTVSRHNGGSSPAAAWVTSAPTPLCGSLAHIFPSALPMDTTRPTGSNRSVASRTVTLKRSCCQLGGRPWLASAGAGDDWSMVSAFGARKNVL